MAFVAGKARLGRTGLGGGFMNRIIAGLMLACAVLLAGCNTVRGMGQDLEKAGEAIQKSSK